MDAQAVHRLVLSLPEVDEYLHGGLPSFRVRGKRFASMLDETGINLMPGDAAIRAAASSWAHACEEIWFAKRLSSVRVAYRKLPPSIVEELVTDAWASKAPRMLVRARNAAS